MLGSFPGLDVHWGLGFGIVFCVGDVRAGAAHDARASRCASSAATRARRAWPGLPVGRLVLLACFLGGAAAGLAGMVEVAAVHGSANASLIAGYGYAGILVAFIARQNPLAIIPVAVLLGGISASGGMLQRRLDLPDATVLVLQGIVFILILGERDAVRPASRSSGRQGGLTWTSSGWWGVPIARARRRASASARRSCS